MKNWWWDLEWLQEGRAVTPKGANARGLDVAKGDKLKATHRVAYFHANAMPPPDMMAPVPADRKAALAAAELVETPAEARARRARGGNAPAHYTPTKALGHSTTFKDT